MPRRKIDLNGVNSSFFVPNSKRGPEYNASIHNLSGQSATITVTNMDVQGGDGAPVYDQPAQGALVIADGAIGELNEPYDGWRIDLGGAGAGFIYITEAGA